MDTICSTHFVGSKMSGSAPYKIGQDLLQSFPLGCVASPLLKAAIIGSAVEPLSSQLPMHRISGGLLTKGTGLHHL